MSHPSRGPPFNRLRDAIEEMEELEWSASAVVRTKFWWIRSTASPKSVRIPIDHNLDERFVGHGTRNTKWKRHTRGVYLIFVCQMVVFRLALVMIPMFSSLFEHLMFDINKDLFNCLIKAAIERHLRCRAFGFWTHTLSSVVVYLPNYIVTDFVKPGRWAEQKRRRSADASACQSIDRFVCARCITNAELEKDENDLLQAFN